MDTLSLEQRLHPAILPAGSAGWVLVKEVSTSVDLEFVQTANEVKVVPPFLHPPLDFLW